MTHFREDTVADAVNLSSKLRRFLVQLRTSYGHRTARHPQTSHFQYYPQFFQKFTFYALQTIQQPVPN